jgi:hypothetical protein
MAWVTVSNDWERKRREITDRFELSEADLHSLRTYNQEQARGLLHTPEWQHRMAGIQARVDQRKAELDSAFTEMHRPSNA